MSGTTFVHPRHDALPSPSSTSSLAVANPFLVSVKRAESTVSIIVTRRLSLSPVGSLISLHHIQSDTPYPSRASSRYFALEEKVRLAVSLPRYAPRHSSPPSQFSLATDPRSWGSNISPEFSEPDDDLHNPDEGQNARSVYRDGHLLSWRGLANMGCLVLMCLGILMLL